MILKKIKKTNFNIDFTAGKYRIKTVNSEEELEQALKLRYQVFQVEMIGLSVEDKLDHDQFDDFADHLIITDSENNKLVATCRINHSDFCTKFYTEQEFFIKPLLDNALKKIEIGRVCIHAEYRKGAVIILLWRAIAEYLKISKAEVLFGCGSIKTLDPKLALTLFKYLQLTNKLKLNSSVMPIGEYRSQVFEELLASDKKQLSETDLVLAKQLLPALCKAYFDIGCFVPCAPAFDYDFKCVDFLTVLNLSELDFKLRQRMFGV